MDENSSSEPSTAKEPETEHTNDSDVEFVETNVSVVCIDDDNVEMTNDQTNSTVPLVTIHFKAPEVYQKLQKAISAALQAVLDEHLPNQPVKIEPGKDGCSVEINEAPDVLEDVGSLFVIDSTPMKNKKNDGPIPSYRKSVNKVYDGQTPPPSASSSQLKRPKAKQTCWNCEGSHALKDCKQPRNYVRIRQKKEEFQKKCERYHADLEQKYGHIRPGHLSLELRNALGLGPRDLPLHVYKMRLFGYPPGWLEDAKITHSGLQLFGSNGDAVQHSDESDGEVDNARMKYDVRKIIEYPGFNEPPPSAMFDDSKYFNVPPYSEDFSRESMIRQLEGTLVGGYRRKKMKLAVEPEAESAVDPTANTELVDMDAMEGSPEPPSSVPKALEELEDGELSSDSDTNNETAVEEQSVILIETPVEVITLNDTPMALPEPDPPSPTLAELQKRQNQLMEQLANSSVATEDYSLISDISLAEKLSDSQEQVAGQAANTSGATEDCSFMNDVMLAEKLAAEANQSTEVTASTSMPPPAPPVVADPPPPPAPPAAPAPSNASPPSEAGPSERPPEPESFDLGELAMNKVPYIDEPASMGLKRMSLGTPILSAFTPYSTLPSGEAFSKGVSDVIHFENLPNSTGKYQQMKSLLSEVRLKMIDHLRETEDGS